MHFVLVAGSHREGSQSGKVARFAAGRLNALSHTTDIIDLVGNPLPLWHNTPEAPFKPTGEVWADYSARLKKAEGLVIVSPEWNGMVPSGLNNLLLHFSPAEVGHKPALIVTVSASRGGAYPVDQLRITGYKNSHMVYLPDHTIVRDAKTVLNGETIENDGDKFVRNRLDFDLRLLAAYAEALAPVRANHPFPPELSSGQ